MQTIFGSNSIDIVHFHRPSFYYHALAGDDVISTYGAVSSVMHGGDGDDSITMKFGYNNTVYGGNGDDYIEFQIDTRLSRAYGGNGNDTMIGSSGSEYLGGQNGDDIIYGGGGLDTLMGHDGNDIIHGGMTKDSIGGGNGNDILYGHGGDDLIEGYFGDDIIYGGDRGDFLLGQGGDDIVYGENYFDRIWGGDGNDSLFGGQDNDTIWGGEGADYIDGGIDNDSLTGDNGADYYAGSSGQDIIYNADTDALTGPDDVLNVNHIASYYAVWLEKSGDDLLVFDCLNSANTTTIDSWFVNTTAGDYTQNAPVKLDLEFKLGPLTFVLDDTLVDDLLQAMDAYGSIANTIDPTGDPGLQLLHTHMDSFWV